jgi:hypothetical protein
LLAGQIVYFRRQGRYHRHRCQRQDLLDQTSFQCSSKRLGSSSYFEP